MMRSCLLERLLPLTDPRFSVRSPPATSRGAGARSSRPGSSVCSQVPQGAAIPMQLRQLEIACDESGFTGTNLLDPTSPVITHASVHLDRPAAAEILTLVRARFRHTSTEYKATQLLRQPQDLEWLLGSLQGVGHVHLTDKPFFITCRLVDFLLGEPTYAAGTSLATDLRPAAVTLHREGPEVFGASRWRGFLDGFVEVMRTKRRPVINASAVDEFYATLADLCSFFPRHSHPESGRLQGILERLSRSRPQLEEVLTLLLDDRSGGPDPLARVTMADSRTDARVQLADLLAGAARHIAVAELQARPDPALAGLLRPYLSRHSLWPDAPSRQRLLGGSGIRSVTRR